MGVNSFARLRTFATLDADLRGATYAEFRALCTKYGTTPQALGLYRTTVLGLQTFTEEERRSYKRPAVPGAQRGQNYFTRVPKVEGRKPESLRGYLDGFHEKLREAVNKDAETKRRADLITKAKAGDGEAIATLRRVYRMTVVPIDGRMKG